MDSMEQLARNIIERCGYPDAQGLGASDVVELANILNLLAESRREHHDCAASMMIDGDDLNDYPCTCGADEWNARVDAVLGQTP